MSLKVFTSRKEAEENGYRVIDVNDIYFEKSILRNDELTAKILMDIDKAKYHSEYTFIGRDEELGAFSKERLSTGCKTLLNILYNPDKCFNVAECGQNALEELKYMDNGAVYWKYPVLILASADIQCNIEYKGKLYNKYIDFLEQTMDIER